MRSYVVTGAARGVGRAVAERLARDGHVVALDREAAEWARGAAGVTAVVGNAAEEADAERAADAAEDVAPLAGWVNNAAVFRDAALHDTPARDVLALIGRSPARCRTPPPRRRSKGSRARSRSTTARAASARTRSPWARSRPGGSTTTSRRRCARCTRCFYVK